MRVKIQGRKYHLKNSVIIRMQGVLSFGIASVCHLTNADGAAVLMLVISVGLLFGKLERRCSDAI